MEKSTCEHLYQKKNQPKKFKHKPKIIKHITVQYVKRRGLLSPYSCGLTYTKKKKKKKEKENKH
jgi:hypothetical protein